MLLTRSRSQDEPVASGVRAAVEAGGGDAGRDADSGRGVALRAPGALNSRLAAPAVTPMNLFIVSNARSPQLGAEWNASGSDRSFNAENIGIQRFW